MLSCSVIWSLDSWMGVGLNGLPSQRVGWGISVLPLLCPRLILFMQPCFILSNLRLLLVEWTPTLHTRGCGSKCPTMTIGGVRPWAWSTLIRIFNVYIYIYIYTQICSRLALMGLSWNPASGRDSREGQDTSNYQRPGTRNFSGSRCSSTKP